MRLRLRLPVVVAMYALATPAASQSILATAVRDTTLQNGLQVIVVPNTSAPFVTVETVFRSGAFVQQVQGYEGLPHLIEHLLFRSDGGSFSTDADKIAASWNGVTSTESVRYYMSFPSANTAKGLDIMARLVRKPDFSKESIEAEKKVVAGEMQRHASDPESLLLTEADLLLWGDVGLTVKSAGGNLLAINGATADKLKEMYNHFYVPNNAAIVIAGDVDSTIFSVVNKAFGSWKRGDDPLAKLSPSPVVPLSSVKKKIITAEVKDVTFLVRWQGPSVTKDAAATYAADVFSGLVNQRVSATQKRLVDAGILDDISLSYETLRDVGPIDLYARTSPDRAAAAAEAIGEELALLVKPDYFGAEDLTLAKKWQAVSTLRGNERAASAADAIASLWGSADLAYYRTYDAKMASQTADDVHSYVAKYIAGKPLAVIVRMPSDAWNQYGVSVQRALGAWGKP
ncbi:MAG TPA: pitrilysin family protein [Gemmatimonadaceae bacterium]